MPKDSIKVQGKVTLVLRDGEGKVIKSFGDNLIVNLGRHRLARIIGGDVDVPSGEKTISKLKVAGGAVDLGGDPLTPDPPTVTDTGLFETDDLKIVAFDFDTPTFSVVNANTTPTVTYQKIITAAATNLLVNEIGAFFGTAGPMFAHYTFATVDLRDTTSNSLEINWQFLF